MKDITNIYLIENLHEISAQYRLLKIKGLKGKNDYQALKQKLIDKYSRMLKHPVTIVEIDGEPNLVVKNDESILKKLNPEQDFGRITLYLELTDKTFNLDFASPDPQVKQICLRFLQFDLNGELRKNPNLWQPSTGGPFLLKTPEVFDGIAVYKGFTFRVIEIPKSGFGIIIDATRKFVSARPLNPYLKKEEFYKHFKGKSFIYQYNPWYEIQVREYDDLNVSQYKIEGTPLIDFIRNTIPKPHSEQLGNLPNDSAVLDYYTTNAETRGAPSGLLYQVLDFQDTGHPEINRKSIIAPQIRFEEIKDYKWNYFNRLKFGLNFLKLAEKTLEIERNILNFPDFELGNNYIHKATDYKSVRDLARERLNKLNDANVGFYTKSPLQNQLFVLPRSIYDRQGTLFLDMLKDTVNKMYPADKYNPMIITYEDRFKDGTDYWAIGNQIIEAVNSSYHKMAMTYGVVMIPRLEKKAKREHDKLSALVIIELKKLGFNCSIIHTEVVNQSFYESKREGKVVYEVKNEKRGRLNGYLSNVAINKVLLNCNKYPFVLNESLNADITIGIDVKDNTAGFTIIDKQGKNFRTDLVESNNKEKLSSDQLRKFLYETVKTELELNNSLLIKNIVIHRDGRLFDTELEGLQAGMKKLKEDFIIPPEAGLNILEIPKKSFLSVRLFSKKWDEEKKKPIYENPPIGLQFYLQDEAFICSTGREFRHDGTSNPLYVKFTYCEMSKTELLTDLFKLTTLAFTKPDDCSRFPLTIKINDLKLSDAASEYDEDALKNLLEDVNITTNE
jgi:hypothetical protein